jgi:predicted nuclease with TOPRIM domain
MDVEFDLKDTDLSRLVLNPSEDSMEVDEKLIGDEVDVSILAQFASKTKSTYEQCKKRYEEMKHEVHSEESVLICLMKYHKEKEFKLPTLWTIRSLILCYLKHEYKVEVTDMRTSK